MFVAIRDALLSRVFGSIKKGVEFLGIDSVELEFFHDKTIYSYDSDQKVCVSEIEKYLENGTRICAILLHNNFNTSEKEKEIEWVINAVEIANKYNIRAIRIDAITQGEKEEPFEVRTNRFVECMQKVIKATKDCTVDMGIENHGFQGNDPAFLEDVITRVNSPRLGITMDTGNFYWAGYPLEKVYKILEKFAPFTKHTHIKNIKYPSEKVNIQRELGWEYGKFVSPIYEGDIDHKKVVNLLKRANYHGELTIEDESLGKFSEEEKKEVLKKDVNYLKSLL